MRFLSQTTHCLLVPQLQQCLKSQGESHSCNIFGRISCLLATQMSRKTKSWLSQKDLAMFLSLLGPYRGMLGLGGRTYAINTQEKLGTVVRSGL